VLVAVIILNFAVAGVPAAQWLRTLGTIWTSQRPESGDKARSAQAPPEERGTAAPEPGKTDPA
jgi:hypothetical protein